MPMKYTVKMFETMISRLKGIHCTQTHLCSHVHVRGQVDEHFETDTGVGEECCRLQIQSKIRGRTTCSVNQQVTNSRGQSGGNE